MQASDLTEIEAPEKSMKSNSKNDENDALRERNSKASKDSRKDEDLFPKISVTQRDQFVLAYTNIPFKGLKMI